MQWLILIVFFCISVLKAPSLAATLEETAKSEGEVVFYSSLNNRQIQTLSDAFHKKYPYIKSTFYRGTSNRLRQRIFSEAQAGRHTFDVVSASGFELQLIKGKGLTEKFVSSQQSFYDKELKDPDGHWTSVHLLLKGMGYNTELVSERIAPKTYEDLLHPRWKGKIGINIRDTEWYINMQRRMGKEKAKSFFKSLAAQNPALREGHNLLAQLLAAGEFHVIANGYAHIIARLAGHGAPVQWVFEKPVITYLHPIALARHAPHPSAGKLFINFVLSKEGQTMLREQGRIPSHRDVNPKVFSLDGVKLFPSDPTLAKDFAPATKEMRAFFGVK